MSSGYDYTAGDSIPVPSDADVKAEDLVIGGDAAIDHDADEAESSGAFGDLLPGIYLLTVAGFGKTEKKLHDTHFNGQPVNYEAWQVSVRFTDSHNTGSIFNHFRLPPNGGNDLLLYNHGTNAAGKAGGFMSAVFGHFIQRLIPGSYEKGKPLSLNARALKNWVGRKVWAVVEDAQAPADPGKVKIDKKTGLPFPPKPQIKLYSFRQFDGDTNPPDDLVKLAEASNRRAAKATPQPAMAAAGSPSVNGHASHEPDDGLGDI